MSEKRSVHFCHTADWHLDFFQYQKKERWQDFFIAANECVKKIIEEKPDFVLHCGDLFHHFKPTPGALRLAVKIFSKLKDAKIPFYVIRGNHDASKAQTQRYGGTILRLLEDLGYLHYIKDTAFHCNDNVVITGIGEYGRRMGIIVEDVFRNNPLDKQKYNILALHGYVQGQLSDTEYDVSGYELANLGYNYVALGHYHKTWIDKENRLYCPGSSEQTSINDWGKPETDGFFQKSTYFSVNANFDEETNEWKAKVKRKSFPVRPKGKFVLDFGENTSIDSIKTKAAAFMKKHDFEGAVIRFHFTGILPKGKQNLVNLSKLPAVKELKALHVIITQDFKGDEKTVVRKGLTGLEAASEILKDKYKFKKKDIGIWLELIKETVTVLGEKTISSEESDEAITIYKVVSDTSKNLSEISKSRKTKKQTPKKKKQTKKSIKKEKTGKLSKDSAKKQEKTKSAQADLSKFM